MMTNCQAKETKKVLKDVYKTITDETNCSNALKFIGDKDKYGSNLSDLLRDIVDLGRKFKNEKVSSNLEDFVKKSKKCLVQKVLSGF
ncbi:MAG: hypothetical protein L6V95_02205 [Candidatus Melainabacteria bacterium]|nr:MAG: hypothetical protein L6V95_02205 [Candidatus Melainabacteria bacterium]